MSALLQAARGVLAAWEDGNLAAAVRELADAVEEADDNPVKPVGDPDEGWGGYKLWDVTPITPTLSIGKDSDGMPRLVDHRPEKRTTGPFRGYVQHWHTDKRGHCWLVKGWREHLDGTKFRQIFSSYRVACKALERWAKKVDPPFAMPPKPWGM